MTDLKLIALAIALAGCKHETTWATTGGEDGMMLVREYRAPDAKAPAWVLRIDLTKANPGSYHQRWSGDSLDLGLSTANGNVAGQLTCAATDDTFTCDDHAFDAKAGRVITYQVDAIGQIGSPAQSDLAAYKPLR